MNKPPRLFTFPQFRERHPAFPVPSLRWIRYNEGRNGFAGAFVKVGSRVLIDESKFFEAIDRLQNKKSRNGLVPRRS